MIDYIWNPIVDYFTISPFWAYLVAGIIISILLGVAGWYFSFLRPIAGVITLVIAGALFGYRKGELDDAARERKKREHEQQRAGGTGWKWPWDNA